MCRLERYLSGQTVRDMERVSVSLMIYILKHDSSAIRNDSHLVPSHSS
jgi:hypothetical protein